MPGVLQKQRLIDFFCFCSENKLSCWCEGKPRRNEGCAGQGAQANAVGGTPVQQDLDDVDDRLRKIQGSRAFNPTINSRSVGPR